MTVLTVNFPVFPCTIDCYFFEEGEWDETLEDYGLVKNDGDGGCYIAQTGPEIYLFSRNPGTMVHEAVHAIHSLFEHYHIYYDNQEDEIFAYYVGYLFSQMYEKFVINQ